VQENYDLALVTSMVVIDAKAVAAPTKALSPAIEKKQASLCTPDEMIIFSCRTGLKVVSVCSSKAASATSGYLQYRFGKPDSRDPLELTLPEEWLPPSKAATGQYEPFAGGGGSWLRFKKGAFSYVAYSGTGRWGPKGETRDKAGIVVERNGKEVANLKCSNRADGELGPDWLDKASIKTRGNEEFLFPD
jgi:hypothetical protein